MVGLGAFIGPPAFSLIAELLGRKFGLIVVGLNHVTSFLILAFAKNVYLFYFARFLGGLGLGGGYCLLPMYIAEISKETRRGTLSQTMTVFWATGNFLPYAIGPFISIRNFNLILAMIPLTFLVFFSIFGTETPFFYVKRNKMESAEKALMRLRAKTKEEVQKELEDIKMFINLKKDGNFLDIVKDRVALKCLLICAVLISSQELSGFCGITFHLQLIFEAAETKIGADFAALMVGVASIISSIGGPFLIDKLGRRVLTIASCFGMCSAHILLGSFFYIHDSTNFSVKGFTWVPIFGLILYICSFNIGICSIPWILTSELFSSNFKQVASFSMSSLCWIVSFTVTAYFNTLNAVLGKAGLFWFFASACLATGIFSIIYVPETNGKSFLQIQEMLHVGASKGSENSRGVKNRENVVQDVMLESY